MLRTMLVAAALTVAGTAAAQGGAAQAGAVVRVDGGQVRGVTANGVTAWKGIPFAAPPTGANRWRAPQPVRPWPGVRDAAAYGHDCAQQPFPSDAAPLGTAPSEDCLVANVWTPAGAKPGAKLPVMVWIYGGGFVNGGSSPAVYSGDRFARDGVVLVSFNYRLGRFGFFAHPALSAAKEGPGGNYGFMDQIAALKWVRRNAAAFGGDPANVTVFGESAGGGSTLNVLASPAARGLFRRVAVMSGGGRGPLIAARKLSADQPGLESAETVGVNFARSVGVEGTGADALAKLRALPADQVVQGLNMATMMRGGGGAATYVGGPIDTGEPAADVALADGRAPAVPIMIGANTADLGFAGAPTLDALFAGFKDPAAARAAYDPQGSGDLKAVTMRVGMDRTMVEPARHLARLTAAKGQPAWHYRFGYVADSMKAKWAGGAPHATDIPWAFDTADIKYGADYTPRDRAAATLWHRYFVNFGKTGDPNGAGLPRWQRLAPDGSAVLLLGPDGTATDGPDPWQARLDATAASVPTK